MENNFINQSKNLFDYFINNSNDLITAGAEPNNLDYAYNIINSLKNNYNQYQFYDLLDVLNNIFLSLKDSNEAAIAFKSQLGELLKNYGCLKETFTR